MDHAQEQRKQSLFIVSDVALCEDREPEFVYAFPAVKLIGLQCYIAMITEVEF